MQQNFNTAKPAKILLVDDNVSDAVLTQEGFKASNFKVNLNHVENGVECMAFLRKEGKYVDEQIPDLILLDLNMPVMDGYEVLEEISKDSDLKKIPVIILTTSSAKSDIIKSYQLRCNSYIVKPLGFAKLKKTIKELGEYWLNTVVLPPK